MKTSSEGNEPFCIIATVTMNEATYAIATLIPNEFR